MNKIKISLAGWGNFPVCSSMVCRPENLRDLNLRDSGSIIARGQGRSYGDAALNDKNEVVLTERLNRFISFDEQTGNLTAEAGVTFRDILETFVPRGWFPPVTPGTEAVSLGGCVAADVHGKNHHADGTIGRWIESIVLLTANEKKQLCSRDQNQDLFAATVGGMGLTGIITEATLKLQRIETAAMVVKHIPTANLDDTIDRLFDTSAEDKYSAAWVDTIARGRHFGRGLLITGHHARAAELTKSKSNPLCLQKSSSLSIPWNMPNRLLNRWDMSLFNRLYYARGCSKKEPFIDSCRNFFYPLDRLQHWNRLYGKKGFIQYQSVLPIRTARQGYIKLFELLAASQYDSFLSVMKRFGPEGEGLLSFPFEGITLTLDMPMRGADLLPLLDKLDSIVLAHGGRCYLAKDARMKPDIFQAMYPKFKHWLQIKKQVDPRGVFDSNLSRRLGMQG